LEISLSFVEGMCIAEPFIGTRFIERLKVLLEARISCFLSLMLIKLPVPVERFEVALKNLASYPRPITGERYLE